jgi:dihydrofolate synthase/folylpolyglutamate synthase
VDGETLATFETPERRFAGLRLALRGRHQVGNATVALSLMEALADMGVVIPDEAMLDGLTRARWPGRLEHIRWHEADVLLDAAHNPAGARAVAGSRMAGTMTLVFGAMRDKDVEACFPPCPARAAACTTAENPRRAGCWRPSRHV